MHPILRTMRCRIRKSEKKNRFKRYIYIECSEHSSSIYRSKEIVSTSVMTLRIRVPLVFARLSALHEKSNETAAARSHHLSINNPARRERIVAREEGNARAKVRKARYLNSSEAERRTNKASGDKYSTSLGKLRQSRVYEPLSLYSELRSFATAHPVAKLSRNGALMEKQAACAQKKKILDLYWAMYRISRGTFVRK